MSGNIGFKIAGEINSDQKGWVVNSAGDINGDGIDDLIIGAAHIDVNGKETGASYLIFGSKIHPKSPIQLSNLKPPQGVVFYGELSRPFFGKSVSGAGDVNADGIDDLLFGAAGNAGTAQRTGASYIVYGKKTPFSSPMSMSTLDGINGFKIQSKQKNHYLGFSVSSAGDFNGDGIDDLVLGAPHGSTHGTWAGSCYVVFGQREGFPTPFQLTTLNGTNGFRMNGITERDHLGVSVSQIGDVNGDGFGDIIIGAHHGNGNTGSSFIIFGSNKKFPAIFDVYNLNGHDGFRINGEVKGDLLGRAVNAAGDLNSDGFDDLIVSSFKSDENHIDSGSAYVVFGREKFPALFNLNNLNGHNGFKIHGTMANDQLGKAISSAGDINGDGIDDLIVAARLAGTTIKKVGFSYVIYGKKDPFTTPLNIASMKSDSGFVIKGQYARDSLGFSVSNAGDINADGIDDLIIGANPKKSTANTSYVLYGKNN